MIAKAKTGSGFGGLARYLKDGGPPEGRVAWCEARNLPSADPLLAARMMRATANRNDMIEKPVYHLSISFDPKDGASPDLMRRVAGQTLTDLGLGEHQALLVAHNDTEHPHIHIMVNRVHPETGKAWNNGHDFARLERSLRQQERALGLREVPGHHHRLDGQPDPGRTGPTTGQLRLAGRSGEPSFDERVRAAAGADFKEAGSWDGLARRLERHGLRLEKRGRGLVVTDGKNVVKGSCIARDASLGALEKRFGPFDRGTVDPDRRAEREPPAAPTSPQATAAAQAMRSLVSAFQQSEDLSASLAAARSEARTASSVLREIRHQVEASVPAREKAFDHALRTAYRDPPRARQAFAGLVERDGAGKALEVLRSDPAAFGPLRGHAVLGLSDGARAEALRSLSGLADQARALTSARQDSAAAFQRLQPATQRHLAALSELDRLEALRRDMPALPAEQFRAGLRAQARILGASASDRLAVEIGREFGKRYGQEVRLTVKDVFRDRSPGKDKDRDVEL